MAVDSRNKRFSFMGFGQAHGSPVVFPNPDGTVDLNDRSQWLYLYHGSGISILLGHPIMKRWGGIPHMRITRPFGGRTW